MAENNLTVAQLSQLVAELSATVDTNGADLNNIYVFLSATLVLLMQVRVIEQCNTRERNLT
jgi:hypothetical protein